MKIECYNHRNEVNRDQLLGKAIVVIDVLRATTVMVTAMHYGAKKILPFESVEAVLAHPRAHEMLKCGERHAQKIQGFDFGNSPLEMTNDRVLDKTLLMTTTNGTATLKACDVGERIFIGSYINALALAQKLALEKKDVVIVCSGTDLQTSVDDVIAAGKIIAHLKDLDESLVLSDMAAMARYLYERSKSDLGAFLSENCIHYRRLQALGAFEDLDYCFSEVAVDLVPYYEDGGIWCG